MAGYKRPLTATDRLGHLTGFWGLCFVCDKAAAWENGDMLRPEWREWRYGGGQAGMRCMGIEWRTATGGVWNSMAIEFAEGGRESAMPDPMQVETGDDVKG